MSDGLSQHIVNCDGDVCFKIESCLKLYFLELQTIILSK